MGDVLRGIWVCLIACTMVHAADGELDRSFGKRGVVIVGSSGGPSFGLGSLAIQPDRRIVAAGTGGSSSSPFGVLLRILSDGTPDVSFGQRDGVEVVSQVGAERVRGYAGLVRQEDGRLVVTGNGGADPIVVRHAATGAIDGTFGSGGVTVLGGSVAGGSLNRNPRLQPDGMLVVGGATDGDGFLARLDANGALDAGFDGDGIATTDFFPFDSPFTNDQLVLPDGRVIVGVAGSLVPLGPAAIIARFTAAGAPDPSFGSGGYPYSISGTVDGLARQPDGKLLSGWTSRGSGQLRFAVRRFDADGIPDDSFGAGGYAVAEATLGYSFVTGLLLQRDGRIVVGGTVDGDPALARFLPDGVLDESFGVGGMARVDLGSGESPAALHDLELLPDGKIVGVGVLNDARGFLVRWGCEDCVPPAQDCAPAPRPGCKSPTLPRSATLDIARGATDARNTLQWSWAKGAALTLAELGDALVTTSYSLCVYDESGPLALVVDSSVPPGGSCGGRPCWKAVGTRGFVRRDKAGNSDGQTKTLVRAGDAGQSNAQVKAKGTRLAMPAMPLGLPLRVQLQASDGTCLETTYSAAGVTRNEATRFKARSD